MNEVKGSINGIRRSYIQRLESIYDMEIDRTDFCTMEVLEALAFFTDVTGREAMAYIDRAGRVLSVIVGEQDRVSLPALKTRRSESRLSGIRCIHTHPERVDEPKLSSQLSAVDIQALKSLRLDAMAAVSISGGKPAYMQVGVLSPSYEGYVNTTTNSGQKQQESPQRENEAPLVPRPAISQPMAEELIVNLFGPYSVANIPDDKLWDEINLADASIRPLQSQKAEAEIARTILVGIDVKPGDPNPLHELLQLANTAGFITVGSMVQPRSKPNKSYYLGYGKLQELVLEIQKLQADAVIFDDELTPAQIRNIQEALGKKIEIIDRTALILDIFSNRASTHEGRLQVELAQAKYLLPRMTGFWTHMSRMGGGGRGGTGARRGEGETQLEVDRRLLRNRVSELEKEINKIKSRRDVQRLARERSNIPVVALVGYTNAGKSTLMNHLSGSDVLAEDKLFATLDPVSRRINYGSGDFLLIDTVGFIRKLPHDLVNAFRATLEEARFADLLLHVVDAASDERAQQMETVYEVLNQLNTSHSPILTVHNKCDISGEFVPIPRDDTGHETVSISAITGMGMDDLRAAITKKLAMSRTEVSVVLPLDAGALVSRIYANGHVLDCSYLEDGIHIIAEVTKEDESRLFASAIKAI